MALDAIELMKGSTVADVGAGSGYMTVKMAKAGRRRPGRCTPTTSSQQMLALLDQRLASEKVTERPAGPRHARRPEAAAGTRST